MILDEKMIWTGKEIKELRLRLGMTQSSLAQRLSCSVDQIKSWELSESHPDPEYLMHLQGLHNIVEMNAASTVQRAVADSIMQENDLEQILDEEISSISE